MKKNKDGSALIITVIIFMFITTVSVAMLSVVSTNYNARVGESKRTQNLYGSESGLDTTYNIIAKNITAANIYGNQKVEDLKKAVQDVEKEADKEKTYNKFDNLDDNDQKALYALQADIDYWKYYQGSENETQEAIDNKKKNGISKDNEAIYDLTNKVFKNGFKEFINNNLKLSVNGSSDLQDNERKYIELEYNNEQNTLDQITQKLNIGDAKVYIGPYPGKNPTDEKMNQINTVINDMLVPKPPEGETQINVSNDLHVECGYDEDGRIKYCSPLYSLNFNLYNEEDYKIAVTSEFKTNPNNQNTAKVGENLKVIETNFVIRVPNYDEIALKESTVNVDPKINQMISSLAIGGDLNVNDANKLSVNGDIFVQGNELTSSNMDVNNRIINKYSGGIKLDNTSPSTQINFNNNVYTRGTFNIKNNVNVGIDGDLYAANIYAGDGNGKSDNSQLTVSKDVVVDNDLTLKATNTILNLNNFYGINDKNSEADDTDMSTKVRNSSSIIINDYTKDARYGVKITGNSYIMGVAHINTENGYQTGESIAVKGNYKAYSVPDTSGNETFTYDNPLQVLNGDVDKKAKHFVKYYTDNNGLIDCGGVYLNPVNTYSIGAIVYNTGDKMRGTHYDSTIQANVINPKRIDYAKKIYIISKNKSYTDNDLFTLYTQMGGANLETVQSLLIKNTTDFGVPQTGIKNNTGEEFAMFSKDRDIVIEGKNFTGTYNNNEIIINAQDVNDVNAVIVTNRKVIIDGDVNFRGNIITGGNLEIIKNSIVNLSYDEYVTQEIQSNNSKIFNDVFGSNFSEEKINDEVLTIQSNSTNFLKTKLWKIVQ